jgi:hypothetical protein
VLPDGTVIDDFDDILTWCLEHGGIVIIDGTEFGVAKPTGDDAQRPFYSGKRKTHTTKTIAVTDGGSNPAHRPCGSPPTGPGPTATPRLTQIRNLPQLA